ncbi:hypothetical protein BH24GEM3_BH24GEM3_11310 [soil metagenome]
MDIRFSLHKPTAPVLAGWLVVGLTLGYSGTALSAQGEASAQIEHDATQREITITLGPIPMHADGNDHHHAASRSFAVLVPVTGWLRGYQVELSDPAGRPLPRTLLHHLNLIAPGERELFSPIMRRVGAAGQKTGRVAAPPGIGYPLQRGDTLLITVMLHDPTGVRVETAAARVRMRYAPATTRAPMLSVYPFYMDVLMRPGARSFDLPPGRTEKSWEGRPAVAGRILGMGGHLHKHAVLLRFEDVTAGRVIWEARPQVDAEGNVVAMPVRNLVWRLGVPLRTEHDYRLTAIYDNPTGHTIPGGGMGALGGIFVPTRRASLPPADRSDPLYTLDRRITIEGIHDDLARADGGAHEHH